MYNDLAEEESEEELSPNFFPVTESQRRKKADSVTCTIEAKLDYKKFREFREVSAIKEIYKFRKVLGEGSFGTVYESIHIPTQL